MSFNVTHATAPLHELPDTTVINLLYYDITAPNEYYFTSELDYMNAVADFVRNPLKAEGIVRHEAQHYSVALAIGIETIHYGLKITESEMEGDRLGHPFISSQGGSVPKIALAAMMAAPTEPSEGDKTDIKALGYKDVNDVGRRVMAWNKQKRGIFIPVPLSFEG